MSCTAEVVCTQTVAEWFHTHVEFVDDDCWGPPPGAVARIVRRLVELVGRAHERGLALPGLGPDSVLIGAGDTISITAASRPGSSADRAGDMRALGVVLGVLATGHPDPIEQPGNPCAADLAPLVRALLDPDPTRRPDAAGLQMLLTGRAPRTGTARVRLAG